MNSEKDKARTRKWIEDNKEHYKEYQKAYQKKYAQKLSEKVRKRKWREKHLKYATEYNKRYNGCKEWKARGLAYRKIKILEGTLCQCCKKELATERHHPNYDEPLRVILLCMRCHKRIHNIQPTKCAGKTDNEGGKKN